MILAWETDRPVAAIREYADVRRDDKNHALDRILIHEMSMEVPAKNGVLPSRAEYQYAGIARHYFILTATDGTTAVLYCDIPINGYRAVNIGEAQSNTNQPGFQKSIQDIGRLTF